MGDLSATADRRLALLPAAFFGAAAAVNVARGTAHDLLWVCNVMNLLLAAALALRWPRGVWLATSWLLVGAPLWLLDAALTGQLDAHSVLTHAGGAVVGVAALRGRPPPPCGVWWQAVAAGVALQLAARALTPPAKNVNVAFAAYSSVEAVLPGAGLAVVWPLNVALFAAALFAVEVTLARLLRRARASY